MSDNPPVLDQRALIRNLRTKRKFGFTRIGLCIKLTNDCVEEELSWSVMDCRMDVVLVKRVAAKSFKLVVSPDEKECTVSDTYYRAYTIDYLVYYISSTAIRNECNI